MTESSRMLITRIITAESCPKCKFYIKALTRQGYEFERYDADAKVNQSQLDKWRITNMPVVQIVEIQGNDDPTVWFQFGPGQVSPRAIEVKKSIIMKEREKKTEQIETLRQLALKKEQHCAKIEAEKEQQV